MKAGKLLVLFFKYVKQVLLQEVIHRFFVFISTSLITLLDPMVEHIREQGLNQGMQHF